MIHEGCLATCGTEYERWPSEDFAAYAEQMMLALDAMSAEELAARYSGEDDPLAAREEDRAYWISVVVQHRDR